MTTHTEHKFEARTSEEERLAHWLATQRCEHTHGQRKPRTQPCQRCEDHGGWWGFVLWNHRTQLMNLLADLLAAEQERNDAAT